MTVSLCIRQGSNRNDSVSVEELDWSAESQVLIPAEHLWCDFKCRPWAKNASLNTNDIWYSHFIHFKTVATEVEIQFLRTWIMFPSLLPQFGSAFFSSKEGDVLVLLSIQWMYKSLVFGDEFLAQSLHLKSHQKCSAGIRRTCLSADQSSSSTLTESSFLFDPCLIHRDTVMLE